MTYRNKILRELSPETLKGLHLRPLKLEAGRELQRPGDAITQVYFMECGVSSMTTSFEDGSQVEVGLFGPETMICVAGLLGATAGLSGVNVQVAGNALASPIQAALGEFRQPSVFQALALRAVEVQLTEAAQSAGCNAKHDIVARLARWLLMCADRVESDTFSVSHSFLANMLGVARPGVSIAAKRLREEGLIAYTRLRIRIADREGLEARACECYRAVKQHLLASAPERASAGLRQMAGRDS